MKGYEMNNRILVTYASKAGSTMEVAERIAKNLSSQNLPVDIQPVGKGTDLTQYQAVVLGSAIRAGNLLPEVKAFMEKHQEQLSQKFFGIFIVCLTMKDETEENYKTVSAYLEPVRAQVKPDKEGLFAGTMNSSKLGFLERMLMKAMKAPEGDYRSWEAIDTWTEELGQEIKATLQLA
jgi:menaquinone-dependent protoporphyrinogen oxidase